VKLGRIYKAFLAISDDKSLPVVAFIDSGADETVISEQLAKKLRLKLYGEYKSVTASKQVIVGKLATVTLSNSEITDKITAGVTDEPFIDEDEGVDVILGIDFLQRNGIKLDFGRESGI
jgi:predicted aspartyl protease